MASPRAVVQFQVYSQGDDQVGRVNFVMALDSDGKMWCRRDGSGEWAEEPSLPDRVTPPPPPCVPPHPVSEVCEQCF